MTAKQSPGVYAPDGSLYITLTDGNGSLAAAGGPGTASTTEMLYNNAGTIDGVSGWTTNGTTTLVGGASTTLSIGGGTALTTSNQTGTGNIVLATSPSLVTPALGVATGTTLALGGATIGTNALAVNGLTSFGPWTFNSSDGTVNYFVSGVSRFRLSDYSEIKMINSGMLTWSGNGSNIVTNQATLSSPSAGILQIGTTAANAGGSILAANHYIGATDVVLTRDAANTLALRNGTAAQTFNLYGSWTDGANYRRVSLFDSGGLHFMLSENAGATAAAAYFAIGGRTGTALRLWAANAGRWEVTTDGHFLALTDNTYDIGASGATRPRTAYLGTSAVIGGAANGTLGLLGASGSKLEILTLTEETTIAAAATTDTAIQIPANAILLAVQVRTTTVIPTAATYTVTGTGSSTVFNTAAVSAAATSTDPGTAAGAFYNATAQTIRITPNAQPADNTGRVRVTIRYILSTPPTS